MKYEYKAKVISVVDGDTVKMSVRLKRSRAKEADLGFHVFIEDGYICVHETIRLQGLNAPEKATDTGRAAEAWLRAVLPPGLVVDAKTFKDRQEKYGRFLAELRVKGSTETVNARLIAEGHAFPWDGRNTKPTA